MPVPVTSATGNVPPGIQGAAVRDNAGAAERERLVGAAVGAGFTGESVADLAGQGVAQHGRLDGQTVTALAFGAGATPTATAGQETALGNVLEQLAQRQAGQTTGVTGAVGASATGPAQPDSARRKQSYEAVKQAGNDVAPRLKQLSELERGSRDSVKTAATRASSVSDRLDPGKAGETLDHAVLSDLAYYGVNPAKQKFALPAGFETPARRDLPAALQPCYDEQTGLLEMPEKGAKALLAQNADTLVVAFAGTQPVDREGHRVHTILSDAQQWLGFFDPMYRDAAGIVNLLLDGADRKVALTGHSLGGGLAAFSAIVNAPAGNQPQSTPRAGLQAVVYNTAGLSSAYLAALGEDKVAAAADRLTSVRVKGDPVSWSGTGSAGSSIKGYFPGRIITLAPPDGARLFSFADPRAHPGGMVIRAVESATGQKAATLTASDTPPT